MDKTTLGMEEEMSDKKLSKAVRHMDGWLADHSDYRFREEYGRVFKIRNDLDGFIDERRAATLESAFNALIDRLDEWRDVVVDGDTVIIQSDTWADLMDIIDTGQREAERLRG